MEPKKTMYLIGYFNEYGYFTLWSYNAIAFSEEDANKILKEARLKGNWNTRDYEIYKVKPEAFERIEEDVGLKEFTLLQNKVQKEIESRYIAWFTDQVPGFAEEIQVYGNWKYSPTKRVAVFQYEYRVYQQSCFMGEEGFKRRSKVEELIDTDIKNQCMYRLAPMIKRIMKENNMTHIRVEFRNTYTKNKLIKGFIENKEA